MSQTTKQSAPPSPDGRPDYLVRLGVLLPCSPEDVEAAYREKVKSAHPDRGGTQQQFLELQTAYERAKEYAKFFASRRRWLAEAIDRYAKAQELTAEIIRRGGSVKTQQLDWLAREIGEDFAQVMETIDGIGLVGPDFDDRDIELLVDNQEALGQLHWLDLSGSRVTEAGVSRLSAFPYLRRLELNGAPVGNGALRTCAGLVQLEWLGLVGTRVNRFGRFWLRVARPEVEIASRPYGASRGFRARVPILAGLCAVYVTLMAVATHMSLSGVKVPQWRVPVDKVFHFTSYAGLAFLLATLGAAVWSGTRGKPWARLVRYLAVLPAVALYGIVDEMTQPAVGRTADPLDWVTDIAGATTGLLVFLAFRTVVKRLARRRWERMAAQRMSPIHLAR